MRRAQVLASLAIMLLTPVAGGEGKAFLASTPRTLAQHGATSRRTHSRSSWDPTGKHLSTEKSGSLPTPATRAAHVRLQRGAHARRAHPRRQHTGPRGSAPRKAASRGPPPAHEGTPGAGTRVLQTTRAPAAPPTDARPARCPRPPRPRPAARSLLPARPPLWAPPHTARAGAAPLTREVVQTGRVHDFGPKLHAGTRARAGDPSPADPGVALGVPPETPPRAQRFRPARPGFREPRRAPRRGGGPRVTLWVTYAGRRGSVTPPAEKAAAFGDAPVLRPQVGGVVPGTDVLEERVTPVANSVKTSELKPIAYL